MTRRRCHLKALCIITGRADDLEREQGHEHGARREGLGRAGETRRPELPRRSPARLKVKVAHHDLRRGLNFHFMCLACPVPSNKIGEMDTSDWSTVQRGLEAERSDWL